MIEVSAIPTTWLGSQGAFTAIIVATVTTFIYKYTKDHNLTIKMPRWCHQWYLMFLLD